MDKKTFTDEEVQRYLRHIDLEGVGPQGQKKLKEAKVCVVGAGGLGSPALLYLAAAGIGTLGIVDGDNVDLSNLQRQVIHSTSAVGTPKTESAKARIREINTHVEVICHNGFLTTENAEEILSGYDFVIEATDHFESKYLINDVCTRIGKAFSIGGVQQFGGQTVTCVPGSRSYRDIFPEAEDTKGCESCAAKGILGVVPGIVGTIQATEAVKYILGIGHLLTDRLLIFDALEMSFFCLES
ncbi:MAG: HesA/MoeB/ThiF family protein [Bacteroidales bacterium]|nr:HesA/MoeB/ThiF family protein [Bacteroidales bacterium]